MVSNKLKFITVLDTTLKERSCSQSRFKCFIHDFSPHSLPPLSDGMPTFSAVGAKHQCLVTHESANGPCGRKCHHSLSEVSCCFVTEKWVGFSMWQREF